MTHYDDLHRERFGPAPPPVAELDRRRAELGDIQYRDPVIIRHYIRRLGGRICDLPGPLLDILATYTKDPT